MKHYFKILFYVKRKEPLRNGCLPIMCRISVNGTFCAFSTHLSVKSNLWNGVTQRVTGRSAEAQHINQLLDEIRYALYDEYLAILKSGTECSSQAVRDKYLGFQTTVMGFLEFFRKHNDEFRSLVGLTRSKNTLNKYIYVCRHLERFIHDVKNLDDIPIYNINRDFLTTFHRWLSDVAGCGTNTIWIYMTAIKRIIRLAIGEGYLSTNPFSGYILHCEMPQKNFLYNEELRRLMLLQPTTPTMRLVLDAFLFSCFTGLAFADIKRLTMQNIVSRNGFTSISIKRTKTHSAVEIPLLNLPKKILVKYHTKQPKCIFDLPSNYHCNNLLRVMLYSVGIYRHITFHSARHTFATTISLANGIPLEVVSTMLGHADVKTTQIYAKVLQKTVQTAFHRVSKRINLYYHHLPEDDN